MTLNGIFFKKSKLLVLIGKIQEKIAKKLFINPKKKRGFCGVFWNKKP